MDKKSILELGVGTGVLGERVKSLVPSTEIDGLDISSEMLKRSKEKAVYNHLYLGSADEHYIPNNMLLYIQHLCSIA